MQQKREREALSKMSGMGSAFGLSGVPGGISSAFGTNYDQIASYSSYYKDKN
jgi:hypothetical protein